MTPQEQQAVLTIALLAAVADGTSTDQEREEIKRVAASLGAEANLALPDAWQDVLLKRVSLAQIVAKLSEAGQRELAYEMAVCVCDADGTASEAEKKFLSELTAALGLGAAQTTRIDTDAAAIAAAPLTGSGPTGAKAQMSDAELDKYILNHAIANGALELLPQSLASMAIIPLQIKMVYRIGQAYGYSLDQGHIKEFLATVGVGLTSQYVEQIGRSLLGGLLGGIAGGIGRGLGRASAGAAFSFATTYALGQLARRYYAGGRQMSSTLLRETYQGLLAQAKGLQGNYAGDIQTKAQTMNAADVVSMVKSS
jgi:uncharacterized protein (DUF697 family)/tellurite resistance protein